MAKKKAQFVAPTAKNKKPIYKRWWFWLLIVSLFFGGGKENNGIAPETGPQYTETAITTEAAETVAITEAEALPAETTEEPTVGIESATAETEIAAEAAHQATYVLNTNSLKFHYASCGSVSDIKDSNKSQFTGTREEILSKGYSPCGRCHP